MKTTKLATQLTHLSSTENFTHGAVNPVIQRTSSIIFPSLEQKTNREQSIDKNKLIYGRKGTNNHFALQDAICQLESAYGCKLFPSGAAAIAASILAFVKQGDHILMSDSSYEPAQKFCNNILPNIGVSHDFFDATNPKSITALVKPNTKIIFLETPCSITVEFNDAALIVKLVKQINPQIIAITDNTWGAGVLFKALEHGFDVSVQSGTKYMIGHSDYLLGTVASNKACFGKLNNWHSYMGMTVDADTAYMALRGLRTLEVRLKQHFYNSSKVASWLAKQPAVDRVNHPAVNKDAIFKQYFTGGNGLFCFSLKQLLTKEQLAEFIDKLNLFKIAYSWGGFESLILNYHPEEIQKIRLASKVSFTGSIFRLHIGLEDPDDLINDLQQAFTRIGC